MAAHSWLTESYNAFPPTSTLGLWSELLLHGDADTHVPFKDHAEKLLGALCENKGEAAGRVQLEVIRGGNHFLSSSKTMKASIRAITSFIASAVVPRPLSSNTPRSGD